MEEQPQIERRYIGDNVYVDFDGDNIILTTDNGRGASNIIFMETRVVNALLKYIEDTRK